MRAYLRGASGSETLLQTEEDGTISGVPDGAATVILRGYDGGEETVQIAADGTLSGSEGALGQHLFLSAQVQAVPTYRTPNAATGSGVNEPRIDWPVAVRWTPTGGWTIDGQGGVLRQMTLDQAKDALKKALDNRRLPVGACLGLVKNRRFLLWSICKTAPNQMSARAFLRGVDGAETLLPDLYDDFSPGTVGTAPPDAVFSTPLGPNGELMQVATEATQAKLTQFLSNLIMVAIPTGPAFGTPFTAVPRAQAQAQGADMSQSALAAIKSAMSAAGNRLMVDVTRASDTLVEGFIISQNATAPEAAAIAQQTAPGTDWAIVNALGAAPATEKKKAGAGMLVAGALAGGTGGFLVGGPMGAVVGGVGGAALASWIA
jgi:hypothetical protein